MLIKNENWFNNRRYLNVRGNLRFSEQITQVVNTIRPKLLRLIKESLEKSMIELRDRQIGNQRHERNSNMKRYEFRIRKYITWEFDRYENNLPQNS